MELNLSFSSSNDSLQNMDYFGFLSDLSSAFACWPPSPVNVNPRFNPSESLELVTMMSSNGMPSQELEFLCNSPSIPLPTMHSHERAPPAPNLAENDEDPSRCRVGNNVHHSSHSQSCRTKALIDRVQTTDDSIGNGERLALGKTADSGNHASEKDPADMNTELALGHEPIELDVDQNNPQGVPGSPQAVPGRRPKRKITLEEIEECRNQGMKMNDALAVFEVSRSTLRRRLNDLGVQWKDRSGNDTNTAGHDYHPPESLHGDPPVRSIINNSTPNESLGEEEPLELPTKHDTYVVKAARGKHKVRFNFSYIGTPGLSELEDLVAENLPLESAKFKVTYQDEDKERITMFKDSHLEYALSLLKKSQSNILRLNVIDI